jgi:putative SOS response-associated peptidase YedK
VWLFSGSGEGIKCLGYNVCMCGRLTLYTPAPKLAEVFGVPLPPAPPDLFSRYNIAPSRLLPCIGTRADGKSRGMVLLPWGLIPALAHGERPKGFSIARAETVAVLPSFADPFRYRRCLVVADGFYEWQKVGPQKGQPYYFRQAGGGPIAFAGLWDAWHTPDDKVYRGCCIITTEPNAILRPVHDRMPVMLDPPDFDLWLDPKVNDPAKLLPLLRPCPPERMEFWPVSRFVNNTRQNDGPKCVERVA